MLNSQVHKGLLTVYCLDWIGDDGKFYSLFVACNDTQIFITPQLRIGVGADTSIESLFFKNLIVSDTKSEWNEKRWKSSYAKVFDAEVLKEIKKFTLPDITNELYAVSSFHVFLNPALGFSLIYHSKSGNYEGVLTFWNQCKTRLNYKDRTFYEFITDLGLSRFVDWIGCEI